MGLGPEGLGCRPAARGAQWGTAPRWRLRQDWLMAHSYSRTSTAGVSGPRGQVLEPPVPLSGCSQVWHWGLWGPLGSPTHVAPRAGLGPGVRDVQGSTQISVHLSCFHPPAPAGQCQAGRCEWQVGMGWAGGGGGGRAGKARLESRARGLPDAETAHLGLPASLAGDGLVSKAARSLRPGGWVTVGGGPVPTPFAEAILH